MCALSKAARISDHNLLVLHILAQSGRPIDKWEIVHRAHHHRRRYDVDIRDIVNTLRRLERSRRIKANYWSRGWYVRKFYTLARADQQEIYASEGTNDSEFNHKGEF